jgi:hypothetical protein
MAALFGNTGLQTFLQWLLNVNAPATCQLDLYVNNHTPTVTDTMSAYTICTLAGYSALTITPSMWAFNASGGVANGLFPVNTFTFSAYGGGTTIYGYVLSQGGAFIAAELYGTPYSVPSGGGALTVGPSAALS